MRRFFVLIFVVAALTGTGLVQSCKKDPGPVEERWANRNYECALVLLEDLRKEVKRQQKVLSDLGKKTDALLIKTDCPIPKHPECNIQLGIKGAATYYAMGGYIVPEGTNSGNDQQAPGTKDSTALGGGIDPSSVKEAQDLVKSSKCHTPVPSKCPTTALLTSLTTLLAEIQNGVDKEEEIRSWYIRLGKPLPDHAPVKELFDSLKNLEEMLQDLTVREQIAAREGGNAKKLYETYHPGEIRAVAVDVLGVAAQEAAARLAFYDKPLSDMEQYLKTHKKEFLTKSRTKARRLPSGVKLNMEECLHRKDCWRFRSCVKRMRLPGMFMIRRTTKGITR